MKRTTLGWGVLVGAVTSGVVVACSLNPQPLPPMSSDGTGGTNDADASAMAADASSPRDGGASLDAGTQSGDGGAIVSDAASDSASPAPPGADASADASSDASSDADAASDGSADADTDAAADAAID